MRGVRYPRTAVYAFFLHVHTGIVSLKGKRKRIGISVLQLRKFGLPSLRCPIDINTMLRGDIRTTRSSRVSEGYGLRGTSICSMHSSCYVCYICKLDLPSLPSWSTGNASLHTE
jgi:hypothetical protein